MTPELPPVRSLCRFDAPDWRLAVMRPRTMLFLPKGEFERCGTRIEEAVVMFAIRVVEWTSGSSLDSVVDTCMRDRIGKRAKS